jgi:hypothetical protein
VNFEAVEAGEIEMEGIGRGVLGCHCICPLFAFPFRVCLR